MLRIIINLVLILVVFGLVALPDATASISKQDAMQWQSVIRAATDEEGKKQKDTEEEEVEKSDTEVEDDESEEEEELTLERLFPEKSFFGPSAYAMAFSCDGRYAAYLYRPFIERRHGSDLWIYDVESGESRRITSVSVMSKFQEATRKVREDRIEKAGKRGKGKSDVDEEEKTDAKTDDIVTGEWNGLLHGSEEFGIPPEGVAFILSLQLESDGEVGGTFRSSIANATITEGNYDADNNELTCTLIEPETGLIGSLLATIDNALMTGTITTDDPPAVFEISAERQTTSDEQNDDEDGENGEHSETAAEDQVSKDDDNDSDAEDEKETGEDTDDETDDEVDLGNVVDDKDAEDEKAPRYGGISSFEWAPETNELLFVSGGDVYQYAIELDEITRLTKTRERERGVQYLPDGSGYTCMRGEAVLKVVFGSHLVEQLDAKFPAGEEMVRYELSPDGTRVAFVTTKGDSPWSKGRSVNIVNYRQRFAQVKQVSRHMPDDPRPNLDWSVYLYEFEDPMTEEGDLGKVFSFTQTGPRDVVSATEWAPDSSRIAFSVFEQSSNLIRVLVAAFPEKDEADSDTDGEAAESEDQEDNAEHEDGGDIDEDAEQKKKASENKDDERTFEDARVVYQFFHNGGPNSPRMMQPYYLPCSRKIAIVTELSGFRHLHILDPMYEQLDQITRGRYEVYPQSISKDHRLLFVTSTKEHPAQRDIYRIELETGQMTRISPIDGYYSRVAVSNDGKNILANFVDYGVLTELVAINTEPEDFQTLTDSHPEEAKELTEPAPELFTYQNRHGQDIYGHMFKPDDWTPEDQRPLLIYVYGGPLGTRKMVTRGSYSTDSYFFGYYMAKKHGYVTCTIDPRGASGYGGLYEKSNFEQVGKPQVEDLVDGAKWFVENHGVDEKRIGIHGWSFGGFQTQMCLYTEPDVFACGIAGAGPTEWENYNSWYSTGTIGQSREGETDLAEFSLLPLAKNLKSRLLLAHGMEDSNVLYQDTVRVYRELLKAGKETLVELFLDPTGGHGMGGDVKRIGRMRKYEEFLVRNLGIWEPQVEEEEEDVEEVKEPESTVEEETTEEDE